jgi:hypothetical protein
MYKTISNEIIRSINSKSNLLNIITDENEELPIKDWIKKYRNVVSAKDILWLLLRKEFLSEKYLRLFVVWCARELFKSIENPDERSVEACNVAERYANGEATKEELLDARDAALNAHVAAYAAVFYDKYDSDSFVIPNYYGTNADYLVIANYYATNAASYAVNDTIDDRFVANYVCKIDRTAQVDKLLTYFE